MRSRQSFLELRQLLIAPTSTEAAKQEHPQA